MSTSESTLPSNSPVRRSLPILLAFLTVCTTPCFAAAYCGDANNDKSVTALDALLVLRTAVGIGEECTGNCECDVDFDREITAGDALATLRAAVTDNLYSGCGFQDACFEDEDCPGGYCGTDPDWSCDAACIIVTTTTTQEIGDECFQDSDCWDDHPGWHCGGSGGYKCVECQFSGDCDSGFICAGFKCVAELNTLVSPR